MKMHRKLSRRGLVVALLLLSCYPARAEDVRDVTDVIKRSFKVQSGGTLHLDLDHGAIEVVSRRGESVVVELELTVGVDSHAEAKRVIESYHPEFDQRGDDVFIRSRFEQREGFWNRWRDGDRMRIRIRVEVPERYNVDFASGFGDVRISRINGDVVGRTGAGSIKIGAVTGRLDVRSGTGNIDISAASGPVEVRTGAGNINLRNISSELVVNTGAGNIEAEITRQPRANSHLETGAGNVTVMLNPRVELDIDASASIGSASTDFPLRVEGGWMRKTIAGPINGGGPLLQMRAGVGNVVIRKL